MWLQQEAEGEGGREEMRLYRLELECGHIVKVKIESKKKFGRKEFYCLKCGLSRKRVKEK